MSIANQIRSEVVDRRTYRRPTSRGPESREQMLYRSHHAHQSQLHARMQSGTHIVEELDELLALSKANKVSTSGRVRWLGGTDYALKRSSCLFNCSFLNVNSVFDVVDAFWLLLNGCGVGFTPQPGTLRGFSRPKYLAHTTRDNSPSFRGRETNLSYVEGGRWNLSAGDSAVAWAKFVGKLFSDECRDGSEHTLHLDFSQIRGAGERLAGYGWICAGSRGLQDASLKLAEILNQRAGWLLSASDIVDVMNLMGTVLSTRRSAEIALLSAHHPEASIFRKLKGPNLSEHPHRTQSNNSLVFSTKPSGPQLMELLVSNLEGYDIGFVNGEAALKRAPWFQGCNPCAEILLPNHGFCNLSEINLPAFNGNLAELENAAYRLGRANYRQTCVDLRDGVLQPTWHQTNETLRLCGVGITGITMCPWLTPYILRRIRQAAWAGACSVANEYGTPRPAAVTTVKPSGTLSKVFGVSSGCHQPVSRYELNTILFDRHDPLVASLRGAGFQMFEHPTQTNGMLIEFPIDNGPNVVENEPAIVQLERYRMLMDSWCDYNVSITVSYDRHEIPAIVDWLDRNWDSFVAVSWMQRIDPWTDPASINQRYLPQRALTPAEFAAKSKDIRPINWSRITETDVQYDIEDAAECAGGACPVR